MFLFSKSILFVGYMDYAMSSDFLSSDLASYVAHGGPNSGNILSLIMFSFIIKIIYGISYVAS